MKRFLLLIGRKQFYVSLILIGISIGLSSYISKFDTIGIEPDNSPNYSWEDGILDLHAEEPLISINFTIYNPYDWVFPFIRLPFWIGLIWGSLNIVYPSYHFVRRLRSSIPNSGGTN